MSVPRFSIRRRTCEFCFAPMTASERTLVFSSQVGPVGLVGGRPGRSGLVGGRPGLSGLEEGRSVLPAPALIGLAFTAVEVAAIARDPWRTVFARPPTAVPNAANATSLFSQKFIFLAPVAFQ